MRDDTINENLARLQHGPLYRFADWPNPDVPNWRAGVYTIWRGPQFVYVGMAGRSLLAGAHETPEASPPLVDARGFSTG